MNRLHNTALAAEKEGEAASRSTALKYLELRVLNPEPRSDSRKANGTDDGPATGVRIAAGAAEEHRARWLAHPTCSTAK